MSHLVHTTRILNNFHQVCSKSRDWKPNKFKYSLGARKPKTPKTGYL